MKTKRPEGALHQDYSFRALDDFNFRSYLLPVLQDPARRQDLIEEHRKRPIYCGTKAGETPEIDTPELSRLLDKLRVADVAGKHCIIEAIPWKQYNIGILPGKRGLEIKMTDESYPTREDAEHAIFLKRLQKLLDHYQVSERN